MVCINVWLSRWTPDSPVAAAASSSISPSLVMCSASMMDLWAPGWLNPGFYTHCPQPQTHGDPLTPFITTHVDNSWEELPVPQMDAVLERWRRHRLVVLTYFPPSPKPPTHLLYGVRPDST